MIERRIFSTVLFGSVLFLSAVTGLGQEKVTGDARPQQTPVPGANGEQGERPNLFAQLWLTPDQIQEIRRLNIERRPLMEAAQQRLRLANRALDMAIYSEQLSSDTTIETCVKEFQAAQAEVARLRFTNEFAVRKVLTPEQLTRFRELRQRFEQRRQMMENGQQPRTMTGRDGQNQKRKFPANNQQQIPH